jgi:hypothetical protein
MMQSARKYSSTPTHNQSVACDKDGNQEPGLGRAPSHSGKLMR